ncbi:MAG: helix-turn-helix domain-containing protein [Prevotella conceptionensis]
MRNISNKNVILGKIKQFYGFKTNKELASFLGVANNTITNWVRRNTIDYDLIFSKCKDIDVNWLLSNDNQEINQKINILDVDIKGQSASEALGTLENESDAIQNMYNSLVRHFGYDNEVAKGDIVFAQIGYIMYICKNLQPIENFRTLYRVYSKIQDREILYKGFHRQMEKNLSTIETLQLCQEEINKIYLFFKELARKMNLAPMDRI